MPKEGSYCPKFATKDCPVLTGPAYLKSLGDDSLSIKYVSQQGEIMDVKKAAGIFQEGQIRNVCSIDGIWQNCPPNLSKK